LIQESNFYVRKNIMGLEFTGWTLLRLIDRGVVAPEVVAPEVVAPEVVAPGVVAPHDGTNVQTAHIKEPAFSPKTKERLRKIKSEENFIKIQVPWIL
jgi:hypothetical protein